MDKKTYIEQESRNLFKFWGTLVLIPGAFLILLLSLLDYSVTPENFQKFFIYRLMASSLLITLFFINKQTISKNFRVAVFIVGTAGVATMVELMIFSFGGHQSTYYAGMIIIYTFVLGFLPLFSIKLIIFFAVMIYSIYLFPILIFDNITNMRIFLNNNIFLSAIASIVIVWRYYSDNVLIKKISLEYDLAQDKQQLQVYSHQLEDLVSQRTKELTISEKKYRELYENANDGIALLDKSGIIIGVNNKFCQMHGFEKNSLIGTSIELLEVEGNKFLLTKRLDSLLNGVSLLYETQHYRKDGGKIFFEISARSLEIEGITYIQAFHRDVTEKKQLQSQFFHAQKMESIGALAGGIAHNFNNILTGILGHVELIRLDGGLDDKTIKRLNVIEESSRKAGEMISKLLGFARRDKYEVIPFSINNVVEDAVKLLEKAVGKRIAIKTELDNDIPLVEGDISQMEQVIMNLIVNARDAMPDGGLIVIRSSCIEAKKGARDIPPYIKEGKYVLLKVSDTGSGIPAEIIDKVFEPFFTTKERGKGTGLGLSMVYGTVKEHRGYITVQSRVKEGSIFDVYLPASNKTLPAVRGMPFAYPRGFETILLVDDEEYALSFIKESLEINGYKVIATNNPISAIDIFKRLSSEIALVITDVVMPLLDGRELIEHVRAIKPTAKILVISGYTRYVVEREDIRADGFLQKPFESSNLLTTVRRILRTENTNVINL